MKVHYQLLTHMRTANPAYAVYFTRNSENETYSAIAAIKQDHRENADKQDQVRAYENLKTNQNRKFIDKSLSFNLSHLQLITISIR